MSGPSLSEVCRSINPRSLASSQTGSRGQDVRQASSTSEYGRGAGDRAHPDNLVHFKKLDRGGHFAAWGKPQLFSEEMRDNFRSLRR
jgi:hypothetical protein